MCLLGLKHQTFISELGEKMREDPAYIQELRRCNPAAKFDQEQVKNTMQMYQRLRDNARQDPRASLENLVKPGALEEFAERVTQLRKDPDAEPILSELDTCPAALLKFWDDKQVLKKLGKSMLRSQVKKTSVLSFHLGLLLKAVVNSLPFQQGLNCDDDEELVSEGRKALEIATGYAKVPPWINFFMSLQTLTY